MASLIDTDVLIDVARDNQAAIDFVDSIEKGWSISSITALKLIVGATSKKDVGKIDALLSSMQIIPLVPTIGTRAYDLLKTYSKSHGLRVFDALIAATAIEEKLMLVTRNEKHFRMIKGLVLLVPKYELKH